jgi:Pyruvate/2-oxoacid:ferredoxin oxidoreductase delta subunit
MALTDPTFRVVLYEGTGAQPLASDERFQTVTALLERGFPVTRAGAERPLAPADRSHVTVLGRFEKPLADEVSNETQSQVRWQSLEGFEPAALAEQLDSQRGELGVAKPGEWKPWFPVIDYDRCTNCMQCLSFCLFGVYGVDGEQRIQVQNNDNCKTNCPACSRVCPEAAIMFPKYKAGPINGDVVSDSDLNREKMKIDISALLGGDVYSMLRNRSERAKSRFSKERDSDKALAERQKCLVKLAALTADVPPEVMMSLPSPEEIARKAEAAKARADAALQKQPTGGSLPA